MKALIEPRPLLDNLARSEETEQISMRENSSEKIIYQIGKTTFIVTPVYQTAQGESLASILLRLMKADVERV